jgi:molecular chaperone Hsp33
VLEQLLAEALVLTALLGSLLKDPGGQLTIQAQTERGIVDLLVCDYKGGELRGYIRHDPERLAELGPHPTLFAVRQGLSGDHLRPAGDQRALSGDRAAGRRGAGEAAQSYFSQSEQIPSIVRLAVRKDERAGSPAG